MGIQIPSLLRTPPQHFDPRPEAGTSLALRAIRPFQSRDHQSCTETAWTGSPAWEGTAHPCSTSHEVLPIMQATRVSRAQVQDHDHNPRPCRLMMLPDTKHVPCKFFRQGACQAGSACPFSHSMDPINQQAPCKYFMKVHYTSTTMLCQPLAEHH